VYLIKKQIPSNHCQVLPQYSTMQLHHGRSRRGALGSAAQPRFAREGPVNDVVSH